MADRPWEGSDVAAAALARLGCSYLALNPGASLRGLHDTLVNPIGPVPELILTLHEEVAVALAHGYAKATGTPMAFAVHDTVGLLHASMAIFNAWVDRAPLVGLVGTGPLDAAKRRPWIDWIHTTNDQTSVVRDWCVWTDQPTSGPALSAGIAAAWRAATSWPAGPALLGFDIDLQESVVDGGAALIEPLTLHRPNRPGADPAVVDDVVAIIGRAERPLIVTDRPLDTDAAALVAELADRTGAALADLGGGNIEAGGPRDVTDRLVDAWERADLVICVDARDPSWRGRGVAPGGGEGPVVVAIGLAAAMARGWMRTESTDPARHELVAHPALALAAIVDSLGSTSRDLAPCFAELAVIETVPADASRSAPFHPGFVAERLAVTVAGRERLVANGWLSRWARRAFRYRPGEFLGRSSGEGLGYGLSASIGAALGRRGSDTLVIDLQGDGELLYTPEALWTAAHHDIPLLIVVEDNGGYHRDVEHQRSIVRRRDDGRGVVGPGLVFERPAVDFVGLSTSFGVTAFGVTGDAAELDRQLAAAIEVVDGGAPALISIPVLGAS